VPRATEGAALGAALLGAKAAGILKSFADVDSVARGTARPERTYEPRPEHARRYTERFAVYREVYPRTRDLSHAIFALAR
jgi:xylulokinase